MTGVDIRGLQRLGLLVTDDQGGVAVIGEKGWTPVPSPLRDLVRQALSVEDTGDDAA